MVGTEEIIAHFTNKGVPLIVPGDVPTIRIRRVDTKALVVTNAAMTEIGDGNYSFIFTLGDPQLDYSVRVDGDPMASGQVTIMERFAWGGIPGIGSDYVRKVLTNRSVTTELGGGAKRIDFYDDDGLTIIDSITISADGLERTNP